MQSTTELMKQMFEGRIDKATLQRLLNSPKDTNRIEVFLEYLQSTVQWKEKILLALGDNIFIVDKGKEPPVTKCRCGHEFGDFRVNWKLQALIFVRNNVELLEEIWPQPGTPDPDWCEVREFYCPGCGRQLAVESVAPGYPIVFEFLPDLKTLYNDWLNRPIESLPECEDHSFSLLERWAKE